MEKKDENNLVRQNAGVMIMIVAILIVVFGLFGYVIYDKFLFSDKKDNTEEKSNTNGNIKEEIKETLLNDVAIKNQLEKSVGVLDIVDLKLSGTTGYYFQGDVYSKGIKNEDISDDAKLYAVLRYSYEKGLYFKTDYNADLYGGVKIADASNINDFYKSMFDNEIKEYKDQAGCPYFEYKDATKKYSGQAACGGTAQCWMDTYINKYTVSGDNYYVYVNFGANCGTSDGTMKIFTDYEHTKAYEGDIKIQSDNGSYFITEENHDKFSEYKYTFTKTKNGNYKFVSIEKVK